MHSEHWSGRFASIDKLIHYICIVQLLYFIMITLARLRQVVALAEHGSFRRAAATLQITQPALTKSIQTLEATLGVRLLDRQPGGVVLTEFGQLVVDHTRDIVATENELLRRIGLLAGLETGTVKVALGPYPCVLTGYKSVGRLLARHPKLNVSIQVAGWRETSRMVADKEVDFGVAELSAAVPHDMLRTELVGQHRARYFCRPGHPILRHRRIGLAELLGFPWATTRIPQRVSAAFPRSAGAAGHIDPFNGDFVPAVEIDVPICFAELIAGSDVIAVGTLTLVEKDIETGALVVVPTPEVKFRSGYGFILNRNRSVSPAAESLMREFQDQEKAASDREKMLENRYLAGTHQMTK